MNSPADANHIVKHNGIAALRSLIDEAERWTALHPCGVEDGLTAPDPLSARSAVPRAPTHDWDDPDISILDDRRGELPDFPLDALSPSWQSWATKQRMVRALPWTTSSCHCSVFLQA